MTDAPIEAGDLVARCHSAGDILDALAARKDALGLSNAFIEDMAQLAAGQIDKMLGPARTRPLNVFKLGDLMEIFALDIVLVHSQAKAERMAGKWEKREMRNVRQAHRVSKAALKRAKPLVIQEMSALGNAARKLLLPATEQRRIALKAARARARLPKAKRSEISKKGWIKRHANTRQQRKSGDAAPLPIEGRRRDSGKANAAGRGDPERRHAQPQKLEILRCQGA